MTSWPRKFVLALLRLYKFAISPWLGNACRYLPTCSEYASQAIGTHGLARGTVLAVSRLLRCHPFASGGYDPVSHMDRRGSDDFAAAHTD